MEKLAQLTGLCASSLRSELLWFTTNFDMQPKTLRDEFEAAVSDGDELCSNSESEEECAVVLDYTGVEQSQRANCNGSCKQCLLCRYRILYRYALNAFALTNLFLAYDLLPLSFIHTSELRTSVQQTEIDRDQTAVITE